MTNTICNSTENVTSILVLKFKISLEQLHSKDLKNLYAQKVLRELQKDKKRYKNIYLYNSQFGQLSDTEWKNIFILAHTL